MGKTMEKLFVGFVAPLTVCAVASAGLVDFEGIGRNSFNYISDDYQPIAGLTITYADVGVYDGGGDHSTGSGFNTFEIAGENSGQKFSFSRAVSMPSVWVSTYFGGNAERSLDVNIRAYSDEAGTALLRESIVATAVHPPGTGYVWTEFTGFSDLKNIRRVEFASTGSAQVDDMEINMVMGSAGEPTGATRGIAMKGDVASVPVPVSCSNPGFESHNFTGWNTRGRGWSIDTKTVSEGEACALCTVKKGDTPELRVCAQQFSGIPANKVVAVSLDVLGVHVAQTPHSKAYLAILCLDAKGGVLKEYRSGVIRPQPTFLQVKVDDAVVFPGTDQVYVMLVVEVYQKATDTELWRFDNVQMKVH